MYTIYYWNSQFEWEEISVDSQFHLEANANRIALSRSDANTIYAVIKNGEELPRSLFINGKQFVELIDYMGNRKQNNL